MGKINMTEKQALEYRIRTYDELDKEDDRIKKSGTDTRLRYFYNHGYLGDSKVNLTSRVHYRNNQLLFLLFRLFLPHKRVLRRIKGHFLSLLWLHG